MDFHGMKRKDLQALCKNHNLSANGTNVEIADRLASHLKKKPVVEETKSKSKKVRFSLEVIDLTKSEDRRNIRKIEDAWTKKSNLKPGFEKNNSYSFDVPARSTRSRKRVMESEPIVVHSSSSPVEKRSGRWGSVDKASAFVDFVMDEQVGVRMTRSAVKASSKLGKEKASFDANLGARVKVEEDCSPRNMTRKVKAVQNNEDETGNIAFFDTSIRQTRTRKSRNVEGCVPLVCENDTVSEIGAQSGTRLSNRKSIAPTNLLTDKPSRPSKQDDMPNESFERETTVQRKRRSGYSGHDEDEIGYIGVSVKRGRPRGSHKEIRNEPSVVQNGTIAEKVTQATMRSEIGKEEIRVLMSRPLRNKEVLPNGVDLPPTTEDSSPWKTPRRVKAGRKYEGQIGNIAALETGTMQTRTRKRRNEEGSVPVVMENDIVSVIRVHPGTWHSNCKSIAPTNLLEGEPIRLSKEDHMANKCFAQETTVQKKRRSEVEIGNIIFPEISTILTRSIKRRRPWERRKEVVEENATIAVNVTEQATTGSRCRSIALINLLDEKSPSLNKQDSSANESYTQEMIMQKKRHSGNFGQEDEVGHNVPESNTVQTRSVTRGRPRGSWKKIGNVPLAMEDGSIAKNTTQATRGSKRKSTALINSLQEKCPGLSNQDPSANESRAQGKTGKDTLASGDSDGGDEEEQILGVPKTITRKSRARKSGNEDRDAPTSVQEQKEHVEKAEEFMEIISSDAPSKRQISMCNSSKDTKDRSSLFYCEDACESAMVENYVDVRQEELECNLEQLNNADVRLEDNTTLEDISHFKNEDKMSIISLSSQDEAPRNFEDEKHLDSTVSVEGQYVEVMQKTTNNLYVRRDLVPEPDDSVDDISDELIKSNEGFKETCCKAGNKAVAHENMPMFSCCLQADAPNNIGDEKHLKFALVNDEGSVEGSVEIVEHVKRNHVDVKKELVLEADGNVDAISDEDSDADGTVDAVSDEHIDAVEVFDDTSDCTFGNKVARDVYTDDPMVAAKTFKETFNDKAGKNVAKDENEMVITFPCSKADTSRSIKVNVHPDCVFEFHIGAPEQGAEVLGKFTKHHIAAEEHSVSEIDGVVDAISDEHIGTAEFVDKISNYTAGSNVDEGEDDMPITSPCTKGNHTLSISKAVTRSSYGFDDPLVSEAIKNDAQLMYETVGCEFSALDVDLSIKISAGNDVQKMGEDVPEHFVEDIRVSALPITTLKEEVASSRSWTPGERFQQETGETVQEGNPEDTRIGIESQLSFNDPSMGSVIGTDIVESVFRENLDIKKAKPHKVPGSVVNLLVINSNDEDSKEECLPVSRHTLNLGLVCNTEKKVKENAETTSKYHASALVKEGTYMDHPLGLVSEEKPGAIRGVALGKHSLVNDLPSEHKYEANISVDEVTPLYEKSQEIIMYPNGHRTLIANLNSYYGLEEPISTEKIADQKEGTVNVEGSVSISQEDMDKLGYRENHIRHKDVDVSDCYTTVLDYATSEVEKKNVNVIEKMGLANAAVDSPNTAKTSSSCSSALPVENVVKTHGDVESKYKTLGYEHSDREINLISGDNEGNEDTGFDQNRTLGEILEAVWMSGAVCENRVMDTNNKLERKDQHCNAEDNDVPQRKLVPSSELYCMEDLNAIMTQQEKEQNIDSSVSMPFSVEEAKLYETWSESTLKKRGGKNIMDEINFMLTRMYISSAMKGRTGFGPRGVQKTPVRLSARLEQSFLARSKMKENIKDTKAEQTPQVAKSGMKRRALEEMQDSGYRRGCLEFR